MSRHSRTAYEWGPAAATSICVFLTVAAGLVFGGFLGWATLTGDVFLTWRVLGWSAWVVAFAAASIVVTRSAVRLYRLRGQQ